MTKLLHARSRSGHKTSCMQPHALWHFSLKWATGQFFHCYLVSQYYSEVSATLAHCAAVTHPSKFIQVRLLHLQENCCRSSVQRLYLGATILYLVLTIPWFYIHSLPLSGRNSASYNQSHNYEYSSIPAHSSVRLVVPPPTTMCMWRARLLPSSLQILALVVLIVAGES